MDLETMLGQGCAIAAASPPPPRTSEAMPSPRGPGSGRGPRSGDVACRRG